MVRDSEAELGERNPKASSSAPQMLRHSCAERSLSSLNPFRRQP
jgi:hypothetical protein